MRCFFAPMEGITGALFRRTHRRFFPGVDRYFMPFLSPSQHHVFTRRELRDILPEQDGDLDAVPQLLTRSGADFLWAAGELARMGYREVNLNLGCPSGTVTAKNKGAGLLRERDILRVLLDGIFDALPDLKISVKTRIGWDDPDQWPALLALLNDYPITLLIIHPRVRTEFYKGRVHRDAFAWAQANTGLPLCYNGDLLTPADVSAAPNVPLMFGRGLQADPSLLRRLRGGERASVAELQAFHDAIYTAYRRDYSGDVPVLHRMRELWNYLAGSFRNTEPLLRAVRKARTCAAYEQAVRPFFARAEMIRE